MTEPIGFELKSLRVDFKIEAETDTSVQKKLIISTDESVVYETDFIAYDNNYFEVPIKLAPRTRYDVQVMIKSAENLITAKTFLKQVKCLNLSAPNGLPTRIKPSKTHCFALLFPLISL